MNKDQILTLFERVIVVLNSKTPESWPDGVAYEISYDEKNLNKIQFSLNRCLITLWERSGGSGKKSVSIQFSVGNNFINGNYETPSVFTRWRCPIWRKWKAIRARIMVLHKESRAILAKKELDEQIAIFNSLYYTQFPDDIDNIFFDDKD
jgi:hypothetical protein